MAVVFNTPEQITGADVPILLGLLPQIHDPLIKAGIARGVASRIPRRDGVDLLTGVLRGLRGRVPDWRDRKARAQYSVADRLAFISNRSMFDDLVEFATDPEYGGARERIAEAIGKTKDPRAVPLLTKLLEDPETVGGAIQGLRRTRVKETIAVIAPFTNDERPGIRAEAKKAIRSLEKVRER
jgi:hypothetical protein